MLKKYFLLSIFALITLQIKAQYNDSIIASLKSRSIQIITTPIPIFDVRVVQNKDWISLFSIPEHPVFDVILTKESEQNLLNKINERRQILKKDTLLTSDIFYIWKPYFDWLHYIDPHFRISTIAAGKEKNKKVAFNIPEFNFININDTIIVDKSLIAEIVKGDQILSVNNIDVNEYLKYTYNDRYSNPFNLMQNYYFKYISNSFSIKIRRGNQVLVIETNGKSANKVLYEVNKSNYNIQLFKDSKSGYIALERFFPNNSHLIKTVHKAIKNFKKEGINNVILDLRKNPGGNGDKFDELMSIFINKPVVEYQKGAKLKVSKDVLPYYNFLTEDMIGKLIDLPEKEVIKEFKTMPKMYIDGVNYYVLMSTNTSSTAATFVNILQYNNVAKLVGEPLLHNALTYGEVIHGKILHGEDFTPTLLSSVSISTVEYDEYTKAVDGVIMPDIPIPYVASDYLTGKDAMLEKLLEYIKTQN